MENTSIKVTDLINKLNERNSQNAKDAILKTIKFKNYVGFLTKETFAKQIINTAHFVYPPNVDVINTSVDELKNMEQIPSINHAKQYLFTAIMLVDLYTNIELDFSNAVNEYDMLAENGVIDYIISNIPDSEITEFKMLIDSQFNMFYEKYFSIKSYIDFKLNELIDSFDGLFNVMNKITTENDFNE